MGETPVPGRNARPKGEAIRVVLLGTLAAEQCERLRGMLSRPAELIMVNDDASRDEMAAVLATAEIVVTLRYDRAMPPAPRLRFLQLAGAGYDAIDLSYLPSGVVVANAYGHEVAIAEYVILAMLLWCTRFIEAQASFRAGSWQMSGRMGAPLAEELSGKTVGILGLGPTGRAVAQRARYLGARVVACTRTRRPEHETEVHHLVGLDRLDDFLPMCDFVVICLALTPDTRGLLGAPQLRRMKSGAVLINIARGPIVDEDALYEALRNGDIAGAVLDTWYTYPSRDNPTASPSHHPFHELPNVYMTPHTAAWTRGMLERRWASIARSIERFDEGLEPENVICHT